MTIPAVVVPAVIGMSRDLNPNETISMTADEASWLGKVFRVAFFSPYNFVFSNNYHKYAVSDFVFSVIFHRIVFGDCFFFLHLL